MARDKQLPLTHEQQLEQDRMIYGSSFEQINSDGTRKRLDPLSVKITSFEDWEDRRKRMNIKKD